MPFGTGVDPIDEQIRAALAGWPQVQDVAVRGLSPCHERRPVRHHRIDRDREAQILAGRNLVDPQRCHDHGTDVVALEVHAQRLDLSQEIIGGRSRAPGTREVVDSRRHHDRIGATADDLVQVWSQRVETLAGDGEGSSAVIG